ADLDWLLTPQVPDGYQHGYQAYVCRFQPEPVTLSNAERLHEQRNRLMMHLEQMGIATRQGTHAPVILGYYAEKYGLTAEQFPNAYLADRLSLTLPLYPQMTTAEQSYVVDTLIAAGP
ncbi:MAG: DegT/DnrJ/EryC1/StrS family aminotransferase, partial [Anaerolineae bacterium]|nr:DegT/DnrJ/EryC1/StrS family aminotransferase [Anaerolineae bacterium]